MTNWEKIEETIYHQMGIPKPFDRRKKLIEEMQTLEEKSVHCFNCPGTCCTMQANSMHVTALEAFEIFMSLKNQGINFNDLLSRLEKTISDYRLDIEIYTGKKNSAALRKKYTCPFFNNGALGCSLSRSIKPYGCLAFNPTQVDDNGKSCASRLPLLVELEEKYGKKEASANVFLQKTLDLQWEKKSIPEALVDLIKFSMHS